MKLMSYASAALSLANMVFAGPYRILAYKPRAFGGIATGCITWLGVALAFPAFVSVSPTDCWWMAWAFLASCAYVQMFAQWCSTSPRRDPASPHCWAGRWGEPFLAIALCFAAGVAGGPGAGLFFVLGFLCSTADWLLRRLRRRWAAWTPEDTARLRAPILAAAARLRALAGSAAQWTRWATPIGGRFALRYGLLAASGVALLLRQARATLAARATQPGLAQGPVARQPGFVSRVATFVVGHTIFSMITGTLGLFGLIKGVGLILSIPAAMLLWLLGGKADLPHFAKDDARSVISRAKEALGDEKEELLQRLHDKREALQERFRHPREEVREQLEDGREEIADKGRSAGRKAAWKLFWR